ncbi:hypothetical protein Nepgr_028916 [Nepenthes gracilis]|uniref:Uncharacterized protein n=1 Tax=Nepenthes gracilis TaxID=150966 RepID=A0AAD3Y2U2_NEPGR|nr:hypothetical protein Nepgr_028916 [Nepenthes gracilis]
MHFGLPQIALRLLALRTISPTYESSSHCIPVTARRQQPEHQGSSSVSANKTTTIAQQFNPSIGDKQRKHNHIRDASDLLLAAVGGAAGSWCFVQNPLPCLCEMAFLCVNIMHDFVLRMFDALHVSHAIGLQDFENAVRCISRSWSGNHCLFVVVVICNSFLKAVVGPCCSLCGRAGTLLSLCSLLNCGEMWCCCLAFNVSLLRLLGALAPAAVLVASTGVLMCISVGC